jgi:hypothetical protein
MEFKVCGSKRNKKFVEAILPSTITQLGLDSSRKAVVIHIEDDGTANMGSTIPVDALDSYIVVVKPHRKLKDIGFTLAHEMVHVRQMAKGILKSVKNGHTWAGKRYSNKTKYLDMPWEQDAFARQEIIFRRAIEE